MDHKFYEYEFLLRAVFPPWKRPKLWKKNGKITSAAFKDNKRGGTSVDRSCDRSMEEAVEYIRSHLSGAVVSVTVQQCRDINAHLEYCPSGSNEYHSEIRKSKVEKMIDDEQAFNLAKVAKLEFMPTNIDD